MKIKTCTERSRSILAVLLMVALVLSGCGIISSPVETEAVIEMNEKTYEATGTLIPPTGTEKPTIKVSMTPDPLKPVTTTVTTTTVATTTTISGHPRELKLKLPDVPSGWLVKSDYEATTLPPWVIGNSRVYLSTNKYPNDAPTTWIELQQNIELNDTVENATENYNNKIKPSPNDIFSLQALKTVNSVVSVPPAKSSDTSVKLYFQKGRYVVSLVYNGPGIASVSVADRIVFITSKARLIEDRITAIAP